MVNSKQKGKRGELEFCHWLKERGIEARRGQQFKGTPDSPDVICEELKAIHIEVKRTEVLRAYHFLEQAANDAGDDQVPVVFHRQNNKDWIAILPANNLINMLKGH